MLGFAELSNAPEVEYANDFLHELIEAGLISTNILNFYHQIEILQDWQNFSDETSSWSSLYSSDPGSDEPFFEDTGEPAHISELDLAKVFRGK